MISEHSHYLPAFTERNGRYQRSACGSWILPTEHSVTPSCPTCQQYLTDIVEDTRAADEVFGTFSPADIVKASHFNPTAGYKPRERSR